MGITGKEFANVYLGRQYNMKGTVIGGDRGLGCGVLIGVPRGAQGSFVLTWEHRNKCIHPKYVDKFSYGLWVPVDPDNIVTVENDPTSNKVTDVDALILDYKDRFKDIQQIIVNDKATVVILKDKKKGVVKTNG